MKGLLKRDFYGVWGWTIFAVLLMVLLFIPARSRPGTYVLYSTLPQVLAMLPVRMLVHGDRASGWKSMVNTLPEGRRQYSAEKILLLLLLGCIMMLSLFVGRMVRLTISYQNMSRVLEIYAEAGETLPYPTDYIGYALWSLRLSASALPVNMYLAPAYFMILSAIQLPVLLLTTGWFAELWEMITWAVSLPVLMWMHQSIWVVNSAEEPVLMNWLRLPWKKIFFAGLLLFVIVAGLSILLSDRIRGRSLWHRRDKRQTEPTSLHAGVRMAVSILVIAGLSLSLGLCLRDAIPTNTIYVYERTETDGNTTHLITNQSPTDLYKKEEYYEFELLWEYTTENFDAFVVGVAGHSCLLWDEEWYLADVRTDKLTAVSIPGEAEQFNTQLLGDAEPVAVALWDEGTRAFAFYSFAAEKLITGYEYARFEDDLVDDNIVAEGKDGMIRMIDPADGTILDSYIQE